MGMEYGGCIMMEYAACIMHDTLMPSFRICHVLYAIVCDVLCALVWVSCVRCLICNVLSRTSMSLVQRMIESCHMYE